MSEQTRYDRVTSLIRKKGKEILPEGSTITLFGSRARGDQRPDSDWDIHILVPGPERLSLEDKSNYSYPFEELGYEINEEINVIVHSFEGWHKKNWFMPLYINIKNEGIIL